MIQKKIEKNKKEKKNNLDENDNIEYVQMRQNQESLFLKL